MIHQKRHLGSPQMNSGFIRKRFRWKSLLRVQFLFFSLFFLVFFSYLICCSFFFPFSFFNISPAFIFSTTQLFLQHCLFAPMKISPFAEMILNSFPFLSNGFCFHQNLFKLMKLFPTMISSSFPVLPDGFV